MSGLVLPDPPVPDPPPPEAHAVSKNTVATAAAMALRFNTTRCFITTTPYNN